MWHLILFFILFFYACVTAVLTGNTQDCILLAHFVIVSKIEFFFEYFNLSSTRGYLKKNVIAKLTDNLIHSYQNIFTHKGKK